MQDSQINYQVMPSLSAEDYAALRDDIAERGVLVPVEYDEDGNILDGHHRVQACEELGLTDWPRFVRKGLTEEGKLNHARKLNLARRQLSRDQRAELWAAMRAEGMSYRQIAEADGTVSHPTVMSALSTGKNLPIEQPEHVTGKDGKKRQAIRTSFIDDSEAGKKEALSRAKEVRAGTNETRRVERLDKLAEISKGNSDLNTKTRFPIVYADPPWRYENPPIGASSRSIENHYPTMTLDEICGLPVGNLATDDAMLYLWATAPKLPECLSVVEAWGFEYRTHMVWDKVHIGMGYHARNQHELLLICKRGQIPPPPAGTQPSSIYSEQRGEHSAKPVFFYEMIEAAYPKLPKIELFCRAPRAGWEAWGNQAAVA